jgi:hypothetical protein
VRRWAIVLAAAIAVLAAPAGARAEVYCVDVGSTTGCDHVESPGGSPGLAAAFAAANASTGLADTIMVGAGTYTGPFAGASGAGALTVTGAGSTGDAVTTLTVTGDAQTILAFHAAGSSASHLHLQVPDKTGDTALNLDGSATDVLIDDPDGSTQAIGVQMNHPDSFTGTVHLGNGSGSVGIERTADGAGPETVSGSAIFATDGIVASSAGWTLDHDSVVVLNHGIQAADGATVSASISLSDTLVHVTTSDPGTCGLVACFALGVSGGSTITARRASVVGADARIPGAEVFGKTAGKTATLDIGSTVISGFAPDIDCEQSGGGAGLLHADYSDFASVETSGGCAAPPPAHDISADPGFAAGGFQPAWSSPLIDAGDPETSLAADATDLGGLQRLVGAAVDIGAFEYQRRPPSVTAATVPQAPVGAPVPFGVTAAADPDPGDTLTFAWQFDDGASAAGPRVTHSFATPGAHTATVVAADPTGLTATSTVSLNVVARPPRPDTTPPTVSKLRITPSAFRAGTRRARLARRAAAAAKIIFTLSEPATVTLTFARREKRHHHVRYATVPAHVELPGAKAGKNTIRFYGRAGAHPLKPATYRLTVVATDRAGNRSSPRRARFSILGGKHG